MSDKPMMLKIAGEITNGLMHSYTSRHKTKFCSESLEGSVLIYFVELFYRVVENSSLYHAWNCLDFRL